MTDNDLVKNLNETAGVRSDTDAHLMALAATRIEELEAKLETATAALRVYAKMTRHGRHARAALGEIEEGWWRRRPT